MSVVQCGLILYNNGKIQVWWVTITAHASNFAECVTGALMVGMGVAESR